MVSLRSIVVALALTAAGAKNLKPREYYESLFIDWMKEHGRTTGDFSGKEFVTRLDNFANAEDKIAMHNAGNSSFTMGHNQFSHMTLEEWRDQILSPYTPEKNLNQEVFTGEGIKAADAVDWVEKGAVTPVKVRLGEKRKMGMAARNVGGANKRGGGGYHMERREIWRNE